MILSQNQLAIKDMVHDFAQNRLLPGAELRDKTSAFPKDELKQMGALGLLGMLVPESHDGAGLDYVSLVVAIEEIAAADGAISTIMSVQNSLMTSALMRYGSEAQKEEFLKPLATGEMIGAFALSEPQAGSDPAKIACSAMRDGDDYVINGSKQFITSGKYGQLALVFAITDKAAGKKGISAFLVPTDTAGYVVARVEKKLGQHCSDTAQLVFENMRIPKENLLGKQGAGYKIALANLEGGRLGIAAQSLGMARAALEAATAYAQERETFGKPIIDHQAVGFKLAEMATKLEAARQLTLHAASLKDQGLPCLKEACMAKLFASESAIDIAHDALQIHGGYGYLEDFAIERICRDVRVSSIYEGTSDIQKLIITREIKHG
jgi:alkylation response protein AidB-like acyl-CoA dehydrogenase